MPMPNNPFYSDTYYPQNIELPLYICDEYQSYDICYIHAINPDISISVNYIWGWFYDQLLITLPFQLRFTEYSIYDKFCLVDRYVPSKYQYAEDYGRKVFDLYKEWSGSAFYETIWLSGKYNNDGYGDLLTSSPLPDLDYMRVFNPYALELELPKGKGSVTLTYYYHDYDYLAKFCINRGCKTFPLQDEPYSILIAIDREIQICSMIVNCDDIEVKQDIESKLDDISPLILYKNLDNLVLLLDEFIDTIFQNTWKTWTANVSNYSLNFEYSTSKVDFVKGDEENFYQDIPGLLKTDLQKWFYIYPKNNLWGNVIDKNDEINGDIYLFDDGYTYINSGEDSNPIWQLVPTYNKLGISMIPRYNYPKSGKSSYNTMYADLSLFSHDYGFGYKTHTLDLTNIPIALADGGWLYETPPNQFKDYFLDQISDPPNSYNGVSGTFVEMKNGVRSYKTPVSRKGIESKDSLFYDYIFLPFGDKDMLVLAYKLNLYYNNNASFFICNYIVWCRSCTVDDNGYVSENFTIVKPETTYISDTLQSQEIDIISHMSGRIFNTTVADSQRLLANDIIYSLNREEVINYIKENIYFTNEFLTTGENNMPDSVRLKELHTWQQEIRDALYADKFAYEDPGNPDNTNRRIANLGYYIERIARILGISVNPDGSVRSIRQSRHIKQGDEIPAGWSIGQWGRNQGGDNEGQKGGSETEDRDGLAYEVRTNKFDLNVFTGQPNKISQGGYVLVENLPQLLHIILDDFDKALGMAEAGANVLPSPNDDDPIPYEGMNTLLAEVAFMLSQLSRNITGTHISSLKNQGMLYELIAAHGVPVNYKKIEVDIGLDDPANLVYPSIEGASSFDQTVWILSQLAFLLGAFLKSKENNEGQTQ